jgi:Glycosyltransferase family 87
MKRIVVLAGVVAIEIAMSIALMPWTNHDRIETTDFVNFYAAATIVRAGNGPILYKAETQDPVLRSILGRKSLDYFLHPPFFAAAMVPLSYLKVEHAFVVWTLFNLALIGLLPLILAECVSCSWLAGRIWDSLGWYFSQSLPR